MRVAAQCWIAVARVITRGKESMINKALAAGCCAAVVVALAPSAQAQTQAPALVIQGGMLIDGTGAPPINNSVIVIEGNRFKTIGRSGEVAIPAGAQIIDARGKTVMPGFIDGHCHWEAFWGELYLHLGITTCVEIETQQDGPWALAQKEGTEMGQIRGPRIWPTGQALGFREGEFDTEGSRSWRNYMKVPNADAARAIVRQKKQEGYEALKLSEFLAPDLVAVVADEAHKLGMGVTTHSWDAIASANAGVDGIEHIWSVGYTSIADPVKRHKLEIDRTAGRIDAEEAGALYEPENYDKVIAPMVVHHVAWTPTIAKWLRPLSSNAQRFWQREQEILGNPDTNFPAAVRVITEYTTEKLFKRYTPEQLEHAKIGYQKSYEFIRRFVQAGGILKEGSDSPRGMAGLLMHEALAMDVEAGVPPMTAIQAATLNVARTFHKDKDYGSVEPGKVADLSIVEGDPLQDIWMTQNVKMVVMNGKLVDNQFHKYVNPIPEFNSWQQLSEHIVVTPYAVAQGSGPTTLKVTGKGFWPFHQVLLNGKELETKFVSRTELDAIVPPEAIVNVGMYLVTVKSRGEPVAQSNPAPFVVSFKSEQARPPVTVP
jgi:imidazolonepropionase-like amidohydrolase